MFCTDTANGILYRTWNVETLLLLDAGLHWNERGCVIILVDCIVLWLLQHNVAKAIAMKRA
jgi:hypothetical protein